MARFLLVLLFFSCPPRAALAEDAAERAATLAESANSLGRSGEFAAALALFEQAYALDPQPVLLYNIGRVAEKLGDWPKAAQALRAFLEIEKDPAQRAKAQQALDAVLAHLPAYVTVTCPVAGAVVEMDGQPAGRTPLKAPLEVKPGRHTLRVVAPPVNGRGVLRPYEQAVELKGSESVAVNAQLVEEPATVKLELEPAGATLTLDGKPIKLPADRQLQLARGEYTLAAQAPGHDPARRTFKVEAGERRTVELALKQTPAPVPAPTVLARPPTSPQPAANPVAVPMESVRAGKDAGSPWYKQWWVWTAAGVLVAGSVTAAVLLAGGGNGRPAAEGNWVVE